MIIIRVYEDFIKTGREKKLAKLVAAGNLPEMIMTSTESDSALLAVELGCSELCGLAVFAFSLFPFMMWSIIDHELPTKIT